MRTLALLAIVLAPLVARAQDAGTPDPAPGSASPATDPSSAAADLKELSRKLDEMIEELDQVADDVNDLDKKITREIVVRESLSEDVNRMKWLQRYITVIVDVGAFAVAGDGSGIRPDYGHLYFPGDAGHVRGDWTIMGDSLSTMINANGEPADIGMSRELQHDTIDSHGNPTMIVNSVALAIGKDVGHHLAVASLVELLPRPDHDILDIELAEIDYRPWPRIAFIVSAGKVESVLGVEYRAQDALTRLTVTPSLICRYTCGRHVGVRSRLDYGRLSVSAALTNGDNFVDRFEPDRSLKANRLPTAAGHFQWKLPVGQGLELGVSGAIGPQDDQSDVSTVQWHYGFDLKLTDLGGFDAIAEWVQGKQPGRTMTVPCDVAKCLTYKGGYVLVDRRMNTWFTPYVRVDWRDAVHTSGTDFIYHSHTTRATIGANFALTSRILGKVEYTFNRERDGIPDFPDDILTSSIVVATD